MSLAVLFPDVVDALKADIALKDVMIKDLSEENTKLRHSRTVLHNVGSKNLNESFRTAQPRRATPYKKRSLSEDGTTTDEDFALGGPTSAGVVIQSSAVGRGLQFQVAATRGNAVTAAGRKEEPIANGEAADIQTLPPLSESQAVSFKLTARQINRVKGPFLKKPLQVGATQISNSNGIVFSDSKDTNSSGRNGKLLKAPSILNGPKYMRTNRSNGYRKNIPSFEGRRISFLKD